MGEVPWFKARKEFVRVHASHGEGDKIYLQVSMALPMAARTGSSRRRSWPLRRYRRPRRVRSRSGGCVWRTRCGGGVFSDSGRRR